MSKNLNDMIDWESFEQKYKDGKGYHNRAKQFLEEGRHHSTVFNVASVALENYLIALCELNGMTPMLHTYNSLMNDIKKYQEFPVELEKEIRSLDLIFGICSIDDFYLGVPELSDSQRVLVMCEQVGEILAANEYN